MKRLLKYISHKTIFWFYSITSIYSILWSYFLKPTEVNSDSLINHLLNLLNFFSLDLYAALYFLRNIRIINFDFYSNALVKIEVMFPLLLLTASLIFYYSKFRDSRLLRYLLSIAIALMVLNFFSGFAYRIFLSDKLSSSTWLNFFIHKVTALFVLIIHYATITKLNTEDELIYTLNSKEKTKLVLATRGQRFMNYLIDCFPRLLVALIISSFLISFVRLGFFDGNLDNPLDEYILRYIFLLIGIILVYYISESLFLRSPAKFLTNTQVIVKEGQNKTYGLVIRTLTRAIPIIDILSYLFSEKGDGLHDEWSKTIVVKNKPRGIAYGWYFLIFPLVMFIPFAPSIITSEIDKMNYRSINAIYEENRKNKALEHKDLGYFFKGELFENDNEFLPSKNYIYSVDSIKSHKIFATRLIQKKDLNDFNETYSLMDFKSEYDEDLLKVVFNKNNLKHPLKLLNPKYTYVIDVRLSKHSWTHSGLGEKVNSYLLDIETNTHKSSLITFKTIKGNLALTEGPTSIRGINLKIDTEKEELENKEHIVEVKLQNQTSLKIATYQIKFTKYGVLDFYEVN